MNIFVTKMNYDTSEVSLRELFEGYGDVSSVKVIMDRETGRSKGYGFVEMPNDSEAKQAIGDLNESEFDGKTIIVKEARPKENSGRDYNSNRRRY